MRKTAAMLVGALLSTTSLVAQEVHRVSGDRVAIYNLAGEVQVVRGSGSEVVVRVRRGGADADRLRIETGDIGGRETLRIVYPADEIVYPEMGRRSNNTMRVRSDGTFSDGGRRNSGDQVRVRGSGRGLEAWADLTIEVPNGRGTEIYLAVGTVEARGVAGDIRIDTGSGGVRTTDMSGRLSIDTGSGSVDVSGMEGDLDVDTGSGRIEVRAVRGRSVILDTGSGRVTGSDIEADEVGVDTGSGGVQLDRVRSRSVSVDTGSGSVELELLTDIDLLDVDTGSGSVTVRATEDLGAMVDIETGSGGIDLDYAVEVRSVRRDRVVGRLGDGRGEIRIDTGSGSVRILRAGRGPR